MEILNQRVFKHARPEFKWAAIDANGDGWLFKNKPIAQENGFWVDVTDKSMTNKGLIDFGRYTFPEDWTKTLIEREAA